MAKTLSLEQKDELISLVKERPELWDLKHELYFSSAHKKRVWTEIGATFNINGKFLFHFHVSNVSYNSRSLLFLVAAKLAANIFNNLRKYYSRVKCSKKSGQEAQDPPKWPLFNSFCFLKQCQPIHSVSTLDVNY
jgi:Alcohol dehydrogenase transcription factor Myb/SANT-like